MVKHKCQYCGLVLYYPRSFIPSSTPVNLVKHKCQYGGLVFNKSFNLHRHYKRKHVGNSQDGFSMATLALAPASAATLTPAPATALAPAPAPAQQVGRGTVESYTLKFKHPFTMVVAAPTGFGKSHWISKLQKHRTTMIDLSPQRIMYLYKCWQPLYGKMRETIPEIESMEGLPYNIQGDSFLDPKVRNLIVIDDLVADSGRVKELFTEGSHHRNLSVICLLPHFYFPVTQTMRKTFSPCRTLQHTSGQDTGKDHKPKDVAGQP